MNSPTTGMPRFKCHKEVWALKIAAIEIESDGSATIAPADTLYGTLTTKAGFDVRFKGTEDDKGYYVRYDDGYESWSPSKAFEEGYSLTGTSKI